MDNIIKALTNIINSYGILSGFFILYLESIIPIIPSSVFIALNIVTYGKAIGLVISWLAVVLGSMTSFIIFKKLHDYFNKKFKNNGKVRSIKKIINKLPFSSLVTLIAIPFTPAFAINIAAGLTNFNTKRFFLAICIGKMPMVYFWGFIGKNLSESLTDITVLLKIIFMILLAFIVSKVVSKIIKEENNV